MFYSSSALQSFVTYPSAKIVSTSFHWGPGRLKASRVLLLNYGEQLFDRRQTFVHWLLQMADSS